MAHRAFDEHMEALDAWKGRALDAEGIALVRKSLTNRSNLLVAKAARLAEDNQLTDLIPDLLTAFQRFFVNAEKSDPQCWAKNALSHALLRLGHLEKDDYLRGLHHHQMEPTWGGRSDSAATLRANCAHALAACEDIPNQELVLLLTDLLVDKDKNVRVEALRTLAQAGDSAVPVVRLRALVPDEDVEVTGACFSALLSIDAQSEIPWVICFLDTPGEASAEAAFALAETHDPIAVRALIDHYHKAAGTEFGDALLSAIAIARLPEGIDFLIGMIESEEREAPAALEALARIASGAELYARVKECVRETGSTRLQKAWEESFAQVPPPEGIRD